MKPITRLMLGLALTLVSGCFVTSVHPYYTAKQVAFDTALLGVWIEPDQTNATAGNWKFERAEGSTYKLTLHGTNRDTGFDAHLFRLKDSTFLDCLPRERQDFFSTPVHFLLRLDQLPPRLKMRILDYDWLRKLLEKNPRAIRHMVVPAPAGSSEKSGRIVLTADTAELQRFILEHLKTEEAWVEPIVLKS